ncbi:terminase small subunit [Streptomyces phage Attoomi]|uniref:Terminase small subunit n=1 Tax=Streptomyces phage Attoomi TaxID=2059881 RepID=A0A2H5BLH4_9CAUD|nr:terminase small subunit [Streptomyces phage Attoomi]AUG87134.1 terminase small subunit [Streptomyces phage Attoomi]
MPGPVPKRSDQRRRRNASDGPAVVKAGAGKAPTIPRASGDWHPIAKRWFQSLKDSGQAQFYEQSDWLTAVYVAEAMSRNLSQGKFSAQLFQSVMSAMTDLLTTEGARRRARVELEREETGEDAEELARVALMDAYRQAAGG